MSPATPAPRDLAVGAEITGPVRLMTAERIEWYDSAMLSAATGTLAQVGSNIHTDEDYARSQGLPAIIADGMIMTNWVSSMLVEHFGMAYVERGELRTKFIKPVPARHDRRVPGPRAVGRAGRRRRARLHAGRLVRGRARHQGRRRPRPGGAAGVSRGSSRVAGPR